MGIVYLYCGDKTINQYFLLDIIYFSNIIMISKLQAYNLMQVQSYGFLTKIMNFVYKFNIQNNVTFENSITDLYRQCPQIRDIKVP